MLRHRFRGLGLRFVPCVVLALTAACASETSPADDDDLDTGGSSGTAGSGGTAASAGTSGSGGQAAGGSAGAIGGSSGAGNTTSQAGDTAGDDDGVAGASGGNGGDSGSAGDDDSASSDDDAGDDDGADDDAADDDGADDDGADDDMGDDDVADDDGADDDPPAGAYEPCSGTPLPELALTPVFELGGSSSPIHAEVPSKDPNSMFIALRGGDLMRGRLDAPEDNPVTVLSLDVNDSSECGFLSFALHPEFDGDVEKRFYVSYNPTCAPIFGAGDPGASVIGEYTLDGDTATFQSSLLEIAQPEGNHNGGLIKFGPDGFLYIGFGDGGGGSDQHGTNGNGQDPSNPLGAILRIDVDDPDTPPTGNLTAADVGGGQVDGRIYHYGVRNPWRFSFDRLTGDLFVGDVGQDTWEEITVAPFESPPLNFGWAAREGFEACPTCNHSLLSGTTATSPIHAYSTAGGAAGGGFKGSVTGGYVYRGQNIPELYGRYIFGDYVRGDLWAITWDPDATGDAKICDEETLEPAVSVNGQSAQIGAQSLVSFAEDADGELYVIGLASGVVWRLDPQ